VAEPVTVLVDARNVQRSLWPNIPDDELVERCWAWAQREGVDAVLVFDGRAPSGIPDERRITVVGTAGESADDWLIRETAARRRSGRPFWLVTSDRALRAAAADGAERVIGGGSFAWSLP
jgi:predicted RNA-binding protein with PIN domain